MEQVIWLVVLCVLLLIEIITLGLTTIWFAGGALVAFLVSLLGVNWVIQIVLFVVISIVLLIFTRPVAIRFLNNKRVATNVDSLIGKEARVTEKINNINGTGTIIVNGQEWTARAIDDANYEIGDQVVIKQISGVKALVTSKKEEEANV